MKYKLGMQTVEAVYDNSGSQNPLIEALPECLGSEQFAKANPVLPAATPGVPEHEHGRAPSGPRPAAHGVRALAVYVLRL